MVETLLAAAIVLLAASGVPGLFRPRKTGGERIATAMMVLGSAIGVVGAIGAIFAGSAGWSVAWTAPGGVFGIRADAISGVFLLQLFVIAGTSAVYGLEYWKQSEHPANGRWLRLFFGLMAAGIAILCVAPTGIVFLAGWEVMTLSCFLAMTAEDHVEPVRAAGRIYLFATRLGTLGLFALFAVLKSVTGTWTLGPSPAAPSTLAFLLALLAFGLKAGIMPLHVWLPGAHARAPSHLSALMSGMMIKSGIYGLVRFSTIFETPPQWWGATILALGIVSGVLGVAFAVGQHDLKRLLAYHSVENIGIICIGLGVALLGRSLGRPELVALGFAGALLHVWNHGIFKALLFLAAGAVIHATGEREIDRLGGLSKRMPNTGLFFLIGAVAICGLPPLNGFVSELLVYLGLFRMTRGGGPWILAAVAVPGLAMIGALAVACFAKAFGAVFLGESRTQRGALARDPGKAMTAPMALLAAICVVVGVAPLAVAPVLDRAIAAWAPRLSPVEIAGLSPMREITIAAAALSFGIAAGWLLLRRRTRASAAVPTWDCGYSAPSAAMQYTSSSFAQMLVKYWSWALRPAVHAPHLTAAFPSRETFQSHVPETVLDHVVLPATRGVGWVLKWVRRMQGGSIQAYVLYVLVALLLLLLWR